MKTERLPTRDVHENRFEREEKLGQALETLPGKTLRDRRPNTHGINVRQTGRRAKAQIPGSKLEPNPMPPVVVPGTRSIWFRLNAPTAIRVCLAGTFNDWDPNTTPLSRFKDGEWRIQKELAPGECEYRFVVDGVWQEDPHAKHAVPNPFGSRNSVIHVA